MAADDKLRAGEPLPQAQAAGTRSAPALLEVENLRVGYGLIEVLKGINLEVQQGEIVCIIGANGAGKTTTLMSLSGCVPVRGGSVRFNGQPIQGRPAHEIVKLGICQSPEGRKIFARLTVLENLKMGAFTRDDEVGIARDLERAFVLFPRLKERISQPGGTLSGGEQQMLAVARAMMGRPKLLLLDEPSLGLAPMIVLQIFEVIRQLNREGVSILLVEQNARMALKVSHRAYVLETGHISNSSRAADLLNDERIKAAYLGE